MKKLSEEIKLLASLSNAFGPPGSEEEVREVLRRELEDYADEVRVDKLGNIFFYHHGKEGYPRVMLAAHMDEVAFIVTFIEKTGFLRFQTLGGITSNIMPGQRILLKGTRGYLKGIIGTKPPHIMKEEERKKVLPTEDLFIDIGAGSLEEAEEKGVEIGTTGVFDVEFTELGGGYLRGKAFNDRAGCTVLAQVFKALRESPYNLIAVGTVQEEVGLRGARTAAWQADPDYALALEGTFAADVPGSRPDRMSAKLKGGPVVTIVDRATITHPTILRTLVRVGKEKGIPFQFKKVPSGGTDAGAIHLTKAGVPSGTVAVPCRYIHGPAAVTHVDDLRNTIALVTEFVKAISAR
ncbi:M42 family metallopeptidase [Candidatus Bathyarchaeota archaeon]|nr:M42 family metallopeptidase [Candidatus Bathyarchaeota archaeon]